MFEPPLGAYFVVDLPGFADGAIRVATRSSFSHAGIYLGDGQILEAEPGGARIAGVDEYAADHYLAWNDEEPLTDATRQTIVSAARALQGVPYGWLDIALLAAASFGLPRLGLLERRCDTGRALICSQLVAVTYEAAGVTTILSGRTHPAEVTPGDLANRITTRAWRTTPTETQ